jgi:hypothetical protein
MRAERGQDGVGACYCRAGRGWVHDVGGDDPQPLLDGDCQAGRVADDGCDLVPGRECLPARLVPVAPVAPKMVSFMMFTCCAS